MDATNSNNINNPYNITTNYKITLDDMWKISNNSNDLGIEGYEIIKTYFDHIRSKTEKKIWKKNTSKTVRPDWPPHNLRDNEGKINWPKKLNYLDDVN